MQPEKDHVKAVLQTDYYCNYCNYCNYCIHSQIQYNRPYNELLKHGVGNSSLLELPVRPDRSVRSKKRLTESGTDLNPISRCFLSFKTVVTSRNILVFKINLPLPKNGCPSHRRFYGPRCTACNISLFISPRHPQGAQQ
jgi:hypothetical protein